MKLFGTVKSFDTLQGNGEIAPETGGAPLRFEKKAISWGTSNPPTVGQRLSYELDSSNGSQPRALNLQTV